MPGCAPCWYTCPGCKTRYRTNAEACACTCDWRVDPYT